MTIVIPCAGLGSRLDDETKYISKAMVTIGQKPAFSYIFDQFSSDDEFVILLGYKGEELRCAIEACYPNYNIKFVTVDKYSGEGSGLGYSLLCAKDLLQKPFLFWACDSIITKKGISSFGVNTTGVAHMTLSKMTVDDIGWYRAVKVVKDRKLKFLNKIDVNIDDLTEATYAYTGIVFIHDYEKFWELSKNPNFISKGESFFLEKVINDEVTITTFMGADEWLDIGRPKGLQRAREVLKGDPNKVILPKPHEAIWFVNGDVIKFHTDPEFIRERVERAEYVLTPKMRRNDLNIPEIIRSNKYTYCYHEVEGKTLSSVLTPPRFKKCINTYFKCAKQCSGGVFIPELVTSFYRDKTKDRIDQYLDKHKWYQNINGRYCIHPLKSIERIDFSRLYNFTSTMNFHGDFHLENILYSEDGTLTFLDWRQDAGKTGFNGDTRYDMAKMYHSLIVDHHKVRYGKFKFEVLDPQSCYVDIEQSAIQSQCIHELRHTCEVMGVDFSDIELLTSFVFLSIAACHDGDGVYPEFLFHLGAFMLDVYMEEHYE